MVNATPQPLYPRKRPRQPLYRGLGRPQGRSGRVWKISPSPGFDPWAAQPVASRYTDCAIKVHLHRHLRYETRYFHEESHPIKLFLQTLLKTKQPCRLRKSSVQSRYILDEMELRKYEGGVTCNGSVLTTSTVSTRELDVPIP